jgi:nucleoside-diphosphate-sugar epimerase
MVSYIQSSVYIKEFDSRILWIFWGMVWMTENPMVFERDNSFIKFKTFNSPNLMNIVVTGSTGFVGKKLIPKLINKGHKILEITIEPEVSEKLYGNKTEKYLISDDQEKFKSKLEAYRPDITVHLASFLSSEDDYQILQKLLNTNIHFYCRLLDALKNTNLKLFINTGTSAEYLYGDGFFAPAYLYSATKIASRAFLDYYSKVYNFKQFTVVPYTIYGGKSSQKKIIDIIYDSINYPTTPIDLSPGDQVLDFIHVDDVTDFYIKILENIEQLPQSTNYHLGTGIGHTLKQVAAIIEQVSQQKTNINWGGKSYRPSDVMYAVAKNDEQLNLFNWSANISLKKGIIDFINGKNTL